MLRLRVAACRCGLPFWVDKAAPLAGQGAASSAARIEKATVKAVCALSCTIAGMRIPRAGVLSRRGLPIMAHGLRHPHACGAHGGIRHLPQSLFAAGAIAQAVARIQRQRRRDQRIDHRRDRGDRAHCAVHRRARRCPRPQATDHGFDLCHRGADAAHEFRVKRAATRGLALRAGDAGATDLHRHSRLYRRRMAAGRGDPGRRALYGGIELRRLLRPARSRLRHRPARLAGRLRRQRAAHARRRHRCCSHAAARAPFRALGGPPRLVTADARAPAQPAPARDLRRRLRRAVQFHLCLP